MKHVGFPNGIKSDKEELKNSIKTETEDKNDERETRRFIILEKDSKKRIGVLDYNSLNMKNKSCSFDIEIGEIECQGKGYGEDALRTFFKYLFEHYNLHRIELDFKASAISNILYSLFLFENKEFFDEELSKILPSIQDKNVKKCIQNLNKN